MLQCFAFTPSGSGSWEWVAYGEEGDYFLIFTVSAQTKAALKVALPQFRELVGR